MNVPAQAQDIHFSQFYASPLNLNPALSGINEGTYRVAGIYRNQWRSISTPFQTYSASFDMRLLQDKLKNDVFGVGGLFLGDKSGDGNLAMYSGAVSASFHKGLDKNHKHFLGLGVQLGYVQKSLQWQQLAFPNQHIGSNFDLNQSNGENISNPKVGYFDMSAGILHQSMIKEFLGIYTGFNVQHLTMPKESFLGEKVKLQPRFVVHGGFRIRVNKSFYITPNYIYQYQNKAQEANVGTGFEFHKPTKASNFVLSVGAWYRPTGNDAAIVSAGVEYYGIKLSAAYDVNVSTLKPASGNRGAFEIAVIYTGLIKPKQPVYPILVPCPDL
jgi:type IX secretion system PorP/SprF family membrane protein